MQSSLVVAFVVEMSDKKVRYVEFIPFAVL